MPRYSEAVKQEAKRLHEAGWSYRKIGEHLDVNNTTVGRWLDSNRHAKSVQTNQVWRSANREKAAAATKRWRLNDLENQRKLDRKRKKEELKNPEKARQNRERSRLWRIKNPERVKAGMRRWGSLNKTKIAANTSKRRAAKLQATPPWLTPEQSNQIDAMFTLRDKLKEETGVKYHVDHIVPLTAKRLIEGKYQHVACGLHVPWNLQVVPAKQNLSKGPRLGILERG